MRTGRTDGQCPFSDVVELLALTKIHRHCDDLGVVLVGQPFDGDRCIKTARVAASTIRSIDRAPRFLSRPSAADRLASGPPLEQSRHFSSCPRVARDHEYRVIPRDSAHHLGQFRLINREREGLSQPRVGAQHEQLLHQINPTQVVRDSATKGRISCPRAVELCSWPTIRAIRRPLDQSQLLDIPRDGRLGCIEAPGAQPLPQLVLAGNGFVGDQLEYGRLAIVLHIYTAM